MKVYFATWLVDRTLGVSLTKKRANVRLLSYYFLSAQGISHPQFVFYIKTGRLDTRKNKE